jgi:hypothetical protein
MKRKTALIAGLGVLLLLTGVALALELWPCPNCNHTPMAAYYTCANHVPPLWFVRDAYQSPDYEPPPPAQMPCPDCGNPCDADSVVCPNCPWSWHR